MKTERKKFRRPRLSEKNRFSRRSRPRNFKGGREGVVRRLVGEPPTSSERRRKNGRRSSKDSRDIGENTPTGRPDGPPSKVRAPRAPPAKDTEPAARPTRRTRLPERKSYAKGKSCDRAFQSYGRKTLSASPGPARGEAPRGPIGSSSRIPNALREISVFRPRAIFAATRRFRDTGGFAKFAGPSSDRPGSKISWT